MIFYAHVFQNRGEREGGRIILDMDNKDRDQGVQKFTVKENDKISKYFERAPIFTKKFATLLEKPDLANFQVKTEKRKKIRSIGEKIITFGQFLEIWEVTEEELKKSTQAIPAFEAYFPTIVTNE